jgi:hypothetical protein
MAYHKKLLELNGELHTMAQWARIYGIASKTLYNRLERGMELRAALTTPVKVVHFEPSHHNITDEDKKRCMKCYHTYGLLYCGDVGCRYILDTGHRRPCPAHNCKVFKPLQGRRPAEPVTIIHKWEGVEGWI